MSVSSGSGVSPSLAHRMTCMAGLAGVGRMRGAMTVTSSMPPKRSESDHRDKPEHADKECEKEH